jgi:hypothetical protein
MEPIVKVGNASVGIGATGTIVLGIVLAFSYGGYDIWDAWIIAAIVLWFAAAATGSRTGSAYMQGMKKAQELQAAGRMGPDAELIALNRTSSGLVMHAISSALVLLILVDMIWKPGA